MEKRASLPLSQRLKGSFNGLDEVRAGKQRTYGTTSIAITSKTIGDDNIKTDLKNISSSELNWRVTGYNVRLVLAVYYRTNSQRFSQVFSPHSQQVMGKRA